MLLIKRNLRSVVPHIALPLICVLQAPLQNGSGDLPWQIRFQLLMFVSCLIPSKGKSKLYNQITLNLENSVSFQFLLEFSSVKLGGRDGVLKIMQRSCLHGRMIQHPSELVFFTFSVYSVTFTDLKRKQSENSKLFGREIAMLHPKWHI